MVELEFHAFANILPLISGKEFTDLINSIKENGQREPIVLFEGKILDGRNRYRACIELGIEPITREFGSEPADGTDPIAFARDMNLYRRQLTVQARAIAAAEYLKMQSADAKENSNDATRVALTQTAAAAAAGISRKSVERAKQVLDGGTKAEIDAVRDDKASLKEMAEKVRARRTDKQKTDFKTPDPPVLKDDTERLKTKTLRDLLTAAFTAKRHTAKRCAQLVAGKAFARWHDKRLPNRLDDLASWIADIASELRKEST